MAGCKIPIKRICEWCEKEFYAQKTTTKYCSNKCNSLAYKQKKREQKVSAAERTTQKNRVQKSIQDIVDRPYLSVAEAAKLLGVSRQTIYDSIYAGRLKASKLTSRFTIIRREDIENMLAERPYEKRQPKDAAVISELYTTEEVCELYSIVPSTLFAIGKREKIPKTYNRGKSYWSKKHIDAYFAKQAPDPSIMDWCTTSEIMNRFEMTQSAVYNLAYDHNIPKKKEGNKTFYSKRHVEQAKGVVKKIEPKYYTVKEIMEKYNFTRDQVYHYIRQHKVTRLKKGRIVLISQEEFDDIFKPPTIIR